MPGAAKKRVLHAISLDQVGGVEVLFNAYLRHSDHTRFEHHILLLRGKSHPMFQPVINRYAASVSMAKYRVGVKIPRRPASWRSSNMHRIFKSLCPDVAVIHNTPGNALLWDAAARNCRNIVYYEHGGAWRSQELAVRQHMEMASLILCNSFAARRMLELRWGLYSDRAIVKLNPLRPEVPGLTEETKTFPKGRRPRIGIAGRLVAVKGFPLAIYALRRLAEIGFEAELIIAGEGPEKRTLQRLSAQLELTGQVTFLGRVVDMSSFYDRIDVFLCPSIREPLGNVCIEAASRGCPIVCTAIDGLPEIVKNGETGICIPPRLPAMQYAEFGGHPEHIPPIVYDPSADALTAAHLPAPADIANALLSILQAEQKYLNMSRAAIQRTVGISNFDFYIKDMDAMITI